MNKETDIEFFLGTFSIDDGVKVSSSGIYNCVNKHNGSLEWSNMLYLEGNAPFNIFWNRAVDMLDRSKGVILNRICHVPSPVFIDCERKTHIFERSKNNVQSIVGQNEFLR